MASRLRWFIESNGLLHASQSGFRNGKSALDHIIGLHDTVYKALNHQRSVLAVFLDFQRAYDLVWRTGLLYKLGQMGICGQMLDGFNRFYRIELFKYVSVVAFPNP